MTAYDAVDLFAGPGGWDVAARDLGLTVIGVEFDHAACETRRAAGHATGNAVPPLLARAVLAALIESAVAEAAA